MKMKDNAKKVFSAPLLLLIWIYQKVISPLKPGCCRYHPTCSEYGKAAIKKHGAIKGGILAFVRILRCNPFGGHGVDEVPEKFKLFKK